ncbi:MAG TPA: SDR family NAD(P)-dependent oxidoreductase [bacterium]|nr:SDR family NAD(P)-dependent oxidoreductase [bacterium]HOL34554.1 SDR family NAD(P)-dependent oxidoreductase [bacterium]HPP07540.1 SDR family NAD(P)-dependent oxidoreductase [bacterium]
MKKVLITGGAGFIGSHLCDALIEKGYKVTIFDSLDRQVHPEGKIPDYINKKANFVKGDVRNYEKFKDVLIFHDYVFHFAAAVGVGQSQYKISKYVDTNICGTANLLDILVNTKHRIKKVIVAASMSSYGEGMARCEKCGIFKPELRNISKSGKRDRKFWEIKCPKCRKIARPIPTTEQSPLSANSIYAISKKEQEEMSLLIGKTYGIPVVSLRFFNVFGPRQSLSNPYTGVTAIFISRIKNNNPPVVFEDGFQTRDFIWVGDVIKANILVLEQDRANYEIFNVGSGKPVTILEIARLLIRMAGKSLQPIVTYNFRKGDVRHCFADIKKIKRMLGFKPEVSLKKGLTMLLDWSKQTDASDGFERALKELKEKKLV